ncbi:MAG: TspO/MBR family protein [Candidatus Omnitrophota bacterium]
MIKKVISLILFVIVCLGLGGIGSVLTYPNIAGWYQGLNKPSWNPPDGVFGPVWTLLYMMIAIAGWRLWLKRGFHDAPFSWGAYTIQWGLNLGWSFLFFGLRNPGAALAEILLLWAAIALTIILFTRQDKGAGALLVPYFLWVSFAVYLNFSIWRLN